MKLADTELREKKTLEELLPEVSQRCMRGEELMEKAFSLQFPSFFHGFRGV